MPPAALHNACRCMRFEALNGVFKRIAAGGNFKNTVWRVVMFWMCRTAYYLEFSLGQTAWDSAEIESELGCIEINNLDEILSLLLPNVMKIIIRKSIQISGREGACTVHRIGRLLHLGRAYVPGMWLMCGTWQDDSVFPASIVEMVGIGETMIVALHCFPSNAISMGENGIASFMVPSGEPVLRVAALYEWVSLIPLWEVQKGPNGVRQFVLMNF